MGRCNMLLVCRVEPLDNGSYFQGSGSVNTGHVCNMSENSTSTKIIVETIGCDPQNNVVVSHPVLIPVIEGRNTLTAANVNSTIL